VGLAGAVCGNALASTSALAALAMHSRSNLE
jgi:hypothetical protein